MEEQKLRAITEKYKQDFRLSMVDNKHQLYSFDKWSKYYLMLPNFTDELVNVNKAKPPIKLIQQQLDEFAKYPKSFPEDDEEYDF